MNRSQLRQQLIAQRALLTPSQRQRAAHQLATQLIQMPWVKAAQHVGVYLATQDELSLQPWIEFAWQHHKNLYAPRCIIANGAPHLEFCSYQPNTPLHPNTFGILEPTSSALSDRTPDLLLMPCLGFDPHTYHRLGYGSAYYDRFLSQCSPKPRTLIIAFSMQALSLQHAPWDQPADGYVTENGRSGQEPSL